MGWVYENPGPFLCVGEGVLRKDLRCNYHFGTLTCTKEPSDLPKDKKWSLYTGYHARQIVNKPEPPICWKCIEEAVLLTPALLTGVSPLGSTDG